jgi:hypothetical protein
MQPLCNHLGFQKGQNRLYLYDQEPEPPGAATLPVRTFHIPSQSNPLKQKPDYSLKVITSPNWTRPRLLSVSQEPTRSPAWPRLLCLAKSHLCLGLFNYAYLLSPAPSSFIYLNLQLMVYPEDGWQWTECLLCLFPWHVSSRIINLCLHHASLFGV